MTKNISGLYESIKHELLQAPGDVVDRIKCLMNSLNAASFDLSNDKIVQICLCFLYLKKKKEKVIDAYEIGNNVVLPWFRKSSSKSEIQGNEKFIEFINGDSIGGVVPKDLYESVNNYLKKVIPEEQEGWHKVKEGWYSIDANNENPNIPSRIAVATDIGIVDVQSPRGQYGIRIGLLCKSTTGLEKSDHEEILNFIKKLGEHALASNISDIEKCSVCNLIKKCQNQTDNNADEVIGQNNQIACILCAMWHDISSQAMVVQAYGQNGQKNLTISENIIPQILILIRDVKAGDKSQKVRYFWFPSQINDLVERKKNKIKNINYQDFLLEIKSKINIGFVGKERNVLMNGLKEMKRETEDAFQEEIKKDLQPNIDEKYKDFFLSKLREELENEKNSFPVTYSLANIAMDFSSVEFIDDWARDKRVKSIQFKDAENSEGYPPRLLIAELVLFENVFDEVLFIPMSAPAAFSKEGSAAFAVTIIEADWVISSEAIAIVQSFAKILFNYLLIDIHKEIENSFNIDEHNLIIAIKNQICRILSTSGKVIEIAGNEIDKAEMFNPFLDYSTAFWVKTNPSNSNQLQLSLARMIEKSFFAAGKKGKKMGFLAMEEMLGHEVIKAYKPVFNSIKSNKEIYAQLALTAILYGIIQSPSNFAEEEIKKIEKEEFKSLAWKIYLLRDIFTTSFIENTLEINRKQIDWLWNYSFNITGDLLIHDNSRLIVKLVQIQLILLINALKHYNKSILPEYFFRLDHSKKIIQYQNILADNHEIGSPGCIELSWNKDIDDLVITVENIAKKPPHESNNKWERGTYQALDLSCQVLYEILEEKYVREEAIKAFFDEAKNKFKFIVRIKGAMK
ncbi:MAG: hypothetical protein SCM96_15255 [Acidobacteriota bacterium]|nr:hypothetical protein [Acidobacteriota bacterium]